MKDASASELEKCTLCANLLVERAVLETTCIAKGCGAILRCCARCAKVIGGRLGQAYGEQLARVALETRHGCPGATK